MKTFKTLLASLALLFVFGPGVIHAQNDDEESIKQRMLERLESTDSLKLEGKVGENNVGVLEQRGPLSPDQSKLMNQENADRRALYTIAAKRLGLTGTVVGQGRAEDLREKSAVGVWLQDRNGSWYKKK